MDHTVHRSHDHPPPPGLEYLPPAPGTYQLPPIQAAAGGAVIDADGTHRNLDDFLGDKLTLLSFVYTRCEDVEGCLLATGVLQMISRELRSQPELAGQVRLITLSFDPEHDTPEVMRRYAAREYQESRWDLRPWVFLTTGSEQEIRPILDAYGQYIVPEFDDQGYLTGDFTHVLKVYLIDRRRWVRNIYSTSFLHPAIAINDLKTLVMEEDNPS